MKVNNLEGEMSKQPVMRLASCWRAWATEVSGVITAPLTPKQLGQLKLLRQRLGDWATLVIRWAMDNWSAFAQQAQLEAGLSSFPDKPHIGFLLAHYHTAVNLMKSKADNAVAVTPREIGFVKMVDSMICDLHKKYEEHMQALADMEQNESDSSAA